MASRLDSRWLRHLQGDDKNKFEQALVNDTLVLGRLLAILEEELNTLDTFDESTSQFDNPNWQFRNAYNAGLRASLKRVMTLLAFLKE